MRKPKNAKENARSRGAQDMESGARVRANRSKRAKSLRKSRVWRPLSVDRANVPSAQTNDADPAEETGIDGQVRAALNDVLSQPVRNDKGQFVRGILQGGEHSIELRRALEPAKRAIVQRVCVQLAVNADDGNETLAGVIDAYAEARVMRQSSFMRLSSLDGPVSNKGRQRALVAVWGSFFDREMRAAERLGLERRARKVKQSTRDWLLDDDRNHQANQAGSTHGDSHDHSEQTEIDQ